MEKKKRKKKRNDCIQRIKEDITFDWKNIYLSAPRSYLLVSLTIWFPEVCLSQHHAMRHLTVQSRTIVKILIMYYIFLFLPLRQKETIELYCIEAFKCNFNLILCINTWHLQVLCLLQNERVTHALQKAHLWLNMAMVFTVHIHMAKQFKNWLE